MYRSNIFLVLFSAMFICSLLYSTNFSRGEEDNADQIYESSIPGYTEKVRIKKIAVIPFYSKPGIAPKERQRSISDNEKFLTITLYKALLNETHGITIVTLQESEKEYLEVLSERPELYYKDAAVEVGRRLKTDSVMLGIISEYREREGSTMGVEAPASVAFSTEVYSTKDYKRLWESYFTETQRALFDNVLEIKKFMNRGGKWITVDELAKEGVRKTAQRFNIFLTEN